MAPKRDQKARRTHPGELHVDLDASTLARRLRGRATLAASAAEEKPFVPVTDQMLQHPDPADWLMWRRTLDSWGYSPLEQVNKTQRREA